MTTDIENAIAVVNDILINDVLTYFQSSHGYSVSDISNIMSQFLAVQQKLLTIDVIMDETYQAIDQKIISFNSSGGTSASVTGMYKNLKLSTTGLDSSVTVSFDEIVASSVDGSKSLLKNFNGSFSALDADVLAINTWYAVYIISDGTNTAGILSASFSAPLLPVGYTHFVRVGAVRTDGTNKYFYPINQIGNRVVYTPTPSTNLTSMRLMASGTLGSVTAPTWSPVNVDQFIPPTSYIPHLIVQSLNNGAQMLAPSNTYGAFNSASNPPPFFGNVSYGRIDQSMVLLSRNVYFACSVSSNLFCFGWEDTI